MAFRIVQVFHRLRSLLAGQMFSTYLALRPFLIGSLKLFSMWWVYPYREGCWLVNDVIDRSVHIYLRQ